MAMRIKRSQVVDLYARCKRQVAGAYLVARTWLRESVLMCNGLISTLRGSLSINGEMARHGIILFTFSLILLGGKQTSETRMLPFVPPPPAYFSTVLRIVLIVISFIVISVIFWALRRFKLVDFSKGCLKATIFVLVLLLSFFILWLTTPAISVWPSKALGIIALLISLAFMAAVFCKWLACKLNNFLKGQFQFIYWLIFWAVYFIGWFKGMSSIPGDSCVFKLAFLIGFLWFSIIGIIYLQASWQRKS